MSPALLLSAAHGRQGQLIPPAVTSSTNLTFSVGTPVSSIVTTSGNPVPSLSASPMPPGLSFVDNGNGTATIFGTPTQPGNYVVNITVENTEATIVVPVNVLVTGTLGTAPQFTSNSSATFTEGTSANFTVSCSGSPVPSISIYLGTLPTGLTFTDNGNGTATISGTPTVVQSKTLALVASNGTLPNAGQSFTVKVVTSNHAPTFTSAASDTFTEGSSGSFTVKVTAVPTAALAVLYGTLPSGVTFTDNGNNTATIAGTPSVTGTFTLGLVASNGVLPNAAQSFTLTVQSPTFAPTFTSPTSASFTESESNSFTVSVTAAPTATLTEGVTLPAGLSFTDNTNNTGTLSGTPTVNGTFNLNFGASNSKGSQNQPFVLTITAAFPPKITSSQGTTFTEGVAGTFTVQTTGTPTPALTKTGSLPSGVNFTDNGDGTATIAGTPTGSTSTITITANNGISPNATQSFTLTIVQPSAWQPDPSLILYQGHGAGWSGGSVWNGSGLTYLTPAGVFQIPDGTTLENATFISPLICKLIPTAVSQSTPSQLASLTFPMDQAKYVVTTDDAQGHIAAEKNSGVTLNPAVVTGTGITATGNAQVLADSMTTNASAGTCTVKLKPSPAYQTNTPSAVSGHTMTIAQQAAQTLYNAIHASPPLIVTVMGTGLTGTVTVTAVNTTTNVVTLSAGTPVKNDNYTFTWTPSLQGLEVGAKYKFEADAAHTFAGQGNPGIKNIVDLTGTNNVTCSNITSQGGAQAGDGGYDPAWVNQAAFELSGQDGVTLTDCTATYNWGDMLDLDVPAVTNIKITNFTGFHCNRVGCDPDGALGGIGLFGISAATATGSGNRTIKLTVGNTGAAVGDTAMVLSVAVQSPKDPGWSTIKGNWTITAVTSTTVTFVVDAGSAPNTADPFPGGEFAYASCITSATAGGSGNKYITVHTSQISSTGDTAIVTDIDPTSGWDPVNGVWPVTATGAGTVTFGPVGTTPTGSFPGGRIGTLDSYALFDNMNISYAGTVGMDLETDAAGLGAGFVLFKDCTLGASSNLLFQELLRGPIVFWNCTLTTQISVEEASAAFSGVTVYFIGGTFNQAAGARFGIDGLPSHASGSNNGATTCSYSTLYARDLAITTGAGNGFTGVAPGPLGSDGATLVMRTCTVDGSAITSAMCQDVSDSGTPSSITANGDGTYTLQYAHNTYPNGTHNAVQNPPFYQYVTPDDGSLGISGPWGVFSTAASPAFTVTIGPVNAADQPAGSPPTGTGTPTIGNFIFGQGTVSVS